MGTGVISRCVVIIQVPHHGQLSVINITEPGVSVSDMVILRS